MFALQRIAKVLCIACLAMLSTTAAADDDGFVTAMQLYDQGRYAAAYGQLSALADSGHGEAARVALLMLRHGQQLYGSQWSASAGQVERWLLLASARQAYFVAEGGD